jgi:hypothetical protein
MRPQGSPKTPGSGRKKGTPNKVTVQTREALWAYIAQCGDDANPFRRLVDLMRTTADEHIIVSCAVALADRLLPKLKAVEVSGDADNPLKLLVEHLESLSEIELQRLAYPEGRPFGLPHEDPSD